MYWFVCLVCTSPKAINKSIENQHEKQTENTCILIKKTRNIPPDIIKKTPKNCPKYVPKPLKMRSRGGSRSRTRKSAQKCVDLWWPWLHLGSHLDSKTHQKNMKKTYEFLKRSRERLLCFFCPFYLHFGCPSASKSGLRKRHATFSENLKKHHRGHQNRGFEPLQNLPENEKKWLRKPLKNTLAFRTCFLMILSHFSWFWGAILESKRLQKPSKNRYGNRCRKRH